MKVPTHVAIILDGNGRWAKAKGLPRTAGHVQGAKNVEKMCEVAYHKGIRYLTLYAFSTENWKRPEDEVGAIMQLLRNYMASCLKLAKKNNMSVRVLGDVTRLDKDLQERIAELEEKTRDYTGLHLQIALNYGSRDEITRAVKKIGEEIAEGKLKPEDITEERISKALDTHEIPDPDLMIRTSGEQRLSNYLLWQMAYAELYFTPVAWPDFDEVELDKALEAYQNRDRRYGLVKEE